MKNVLIVGGGSGATILANSLDPKTFAVTVLSASGRHIFQPALLYIAFRNASTHIGRSERRLLNRHVQFERRAVTSIDLRARSVRTEDGRERTYDTVVLATGITTDPARVPGLAAANAEFGDYHSTVPQAMKIWQQLKHFQGGTIVIGQAGPICKCPPSPLEGIFLTEELLRRRGLRRKARLVYFTPYPRAYPAEPMNEIVEPILRERGIEVCTFFDLEQVDPANRTLHSLEGQQIAYDLAFIAPPFVGASIRYEPAEVLDEDRLLRADKHTLRVLGVEDAYALGDAANLPTSKAGVGAHLQAKVIAKELAGEAAQFDGRTNCPLDMGYGKGTFIISSYTAPVVKYRSSRMKHFMKAMMARIYWMSLRGWLDPLFDLYFWSTAPPTPTAGKPAEPPHDRLAA